MPFQPVFKPGKKWQVDSLRQPISIIPEGRGPCPGGCWWRPSRKGRPPARPSVCSSGRPPLAGRTCRSWCLLAPWLWSQGRPSQSWTTTVSNPKREFFGRGAEFFFFGADIFAWLALSLQVCELRNILRHVTTGLLFYFFLEGMLIKIFRN